MINIAPGIEEIISPQVCSVVHIMQLEAISYSKIPEFGPYRQYGLSVKVKRIGLPPLTP